MSSNVQSKTPVITQATVDAALARARVERARMVRAVFAGLVQAVRRLGTGRLAGTASMAAR